jgi:hypothetical protein
VEELGDDETLFTARRLNVEPVHEGLVIPPAGETRSTPSPEIAATMLR